LKDNTSQPLPGGSITYELFEKNFSSGITIVEDISKFPEVVYVSFDGIS
jgi:hypothetical protein